MNDQQVQKEQSETCLKWGIDLIQFEVNISIYFLTCFSGQPELHVLVYYTVHWSILITTTLVDTGQ